MNMTTIYACIGRNELVADLRAAPATLRDLSEAHKPKRLRCGAAALEKTEPLLALFRSWGRRSGWRGALLAGGRQGLTVLRLGYIWPINEALAGRFHLALLLSGWGICLVGGLRHNHRRAYRTANGSRRNGKRCLVIALGAYEVQISKGIIWQAIKVVQHIKHSAAGLGRQTQRRLRYHQPLAKSK